MMMALGGLAVFLLVLLPGIAFWFVLGQAAKASLRGLEVLFLGLLAGLTTVSWLALTLAELELFSLPWLTGLVMGVTILLVGVGWRRGYRWRPLRQLRWGWPDLVVGLLLLAAVLLSGRPSEYIVGGRDHGVYVNTGIHIAKTGGILVYDTEITAVPEALRSVLVWPETRPYQAGFPGPWSEGQRLSGLTIRDTDAGIYVPHAFHLYPALIAVFFAAGGVPLALLTTMILALLGSLAIYLTTARLLGQPVGLLTLLLLTFSVTQVWFMGYPTAEIMVQFFFWGGLFALILLLESGDGTTAVLAGASFGLLSLAKLDTVLIPVLLGVAFLYLWLRQQFRPAYWWGVGVYLLLNVQAVWHASFIATIYFLDHLIRSILPTFLADPLVVAATNYPYPTDWLTRLLTANWLPLLLGAGIFVTAIILLRYGRERLGWVLSRLFQQPRRWQIGLPIGIGILVLGTAVTSQISELPLPFISEQAVQLTRLYLTRAGLLAGGIGLLMLIYQAEATAVRIALFILLGNVAPLYLLGAGTALDHFWVVRRFMPLAFPAFIMGMAWLIWFLRPRGRVPWVAGTVPLGLLLLLLAGFGQHVRAIAGVVEYDGLTQQLTQLAGQLPDDAILLMDTQTPAQILDLPLWFLFDQTVFTIRTEVREDAALSTAVATWQASGRSVYWLTVNGAAPPQWTQGQAQLVFSQAMNLPLMEMPKDHIPAKLNNFQAALDIYQIFEP
ncbi:MAG: hypothetical protein R3D55_20085 [Chloroflexota bacterium]